MSEKPNYKELELRVRELEKAESEHKLTEDALRESEERYKTLVDGGLFGVIIHDDGPFLITEPAAEMWGYDSPEEMAKAMQGDIRNIFPPEYREDMKEKRAQRYKTKETSVAEMEGLRKDGSRFPIMVSISVVPWKEAPRKIAIQCSYLDLTEINKVRNDSEEALRESEGRYRDLFELSPDSIVIWQDEKAALVNPAAISMFGGTSSEEIINMSIYERYPVESHDKLRSRLQYIHDTGIPTAPAEYKFIRLDGQMIDVETSGTRIILKDRPGVLSIYRDITERKQTEEALRESEEKYKSLTENSIAGIFIHQDDKYVYVNDKFAEMHGYQSNELLGINHYDLIHPDQRELIKERAYKRIEGEQVPKQYEIKRLHKNGHVVWHEIMVGDPIIYKGKHAIMGHEIDITERKQAEEKVQEQYRFLKTLFDAIPFPFYIKDRNAKYLGCSPSYAEIIGINAEEVVGKRAGDIFSDDIAAIHNQADQDLFQNPGTQVYEYRLKYADGSLHDNIVSKATYNDDNSNLVGMVGFYTDITDRKRAEEALRESEEKYRLLFEMESDVILLLRKSDGQILEINRASSLLYGYTREELLNMKVMDLSSEPEETRKAVLEDIERIPIRYHRKKDGTVFPVEISGSTLNWKGQDARIATIRDISDRIEAEKEKTELEEQLRQMHKMEAIGTLSGGIAHDFNNILGIMIGNTELAMDDIPEWNPAHSNLDEIKKAGLRAKDVIRQLLSFSRKSEYGQKPVKIAPLIKESVKFLRSSIPSSIEIRQNISVFTDVISGDATQIHQVMLNLCTNAAHAMEEEGGIMEISLTNVQLDESEVKQHHGLKPGPHVILSISDTGCGIEPEIKDRLFDPYFTTKEVDKGTGMGLAVVHGIVKNNDGDITIESEPGKGTTVHLLFPAVETVENEFATKAPEAIPEGNERILFIDDEPAIIKMGRQMLKRLGYKCESKTSPIEALELFQSNPAQFDLVITDMTMPQITGEKLSEEILNIRPDIPIILCTGYSERMDEQKSKEKGVGALIMKPIVMSDIAKTIRQVLDRK